MIKRLASFIVGLGLIGFVVILGIKSAKDASLVLWFGIASTIVAPLGLSALGYSFRGQKQEILEQLSKVSAIEELIHQAKTQEERVRLLEKERERIEEVVRAETLKQAVLERKEMLEKEAAKILNELVAIDQEIKILDSAYEASLAKTEVKQLQKRIQARKRGDIVIPVGSKFYHIDRDLIFAITPFRLGHLVMLYFKLVEKMLRKPTLNKSS